MSTIKISDLTSSGAIVGNVLVPVVGNVAGTLTTLKGNVDQLQTYILENAGNIIPRASNTYSIGNSTTWWKDLWLSANTLYIGGVPIGTSGGQLTFGGNAVGTSGLDTYSGNVSASNISAGSTTIGNITTAPTFSVEGTTGNITAGNIASVGNLATASVSTPSVTTDVVSVGSSVDFVTGAVPYDGATMVDGGNGYGWGFLYYPSGGTGTGLSVMVSGVSYPSGTITGYTVYQGGSGYTVGDILTIDDAGDGTAQFSIDTVTTEGTMTSGASTWTFDPTGTTTFPGDTTIDTAGNISAGNVSVYTVESDTVSLAGSDLLPSSDGGFIFSTATWQTNVTDQYWAGSPAGVTWFNVTDTSLVYEGMRIFWMTPSGDSFVGHDIGVVTGISGSNISCTPLTGVTPNFMEGSRVTFGSYSPLMTDVINAPDGEILIDGNITLADNTGIYNADADTAVFTSNVVNDVTGVSLTDAGDATVYADQSVVLQSDVSGSTQTWEFTANGNIILPTGEISTLSSGNLYVGAEAGKAVTIASNAGAKAWNFNSNGSVTFPDGTLQTTAGTDYSNVQAQSFFVTNLPNYSGNVGGNILVNGTLSVSNIASPLLANSAGTIGQISWDTNYIYICIATNTWKRANISTW